MVFLLEGFSGTSCAGVTGDGVVANMAEDSDCEREDWRQRSCHHDRGAKSEQKSHGVDDNNQILMLLMFSNKFKEAPTL